MAITKNINITETRNIKMLKLPISYILYAFNKQAIVNSSFIPSNKFLIK